MRAVKGPGVASVSDIATTSPLRSSSPHSISSSSRKSPSTREEDTPWLSPSMAKSSRGAKATTENWVMKTAPLVLENVRDCIDMTWIRVLPCVVVVPEP